MVAPKWARLFTIASSDTPPLATRARLCYLPIVTYLAKIPYFPVRSLSGARWAGLVAVVLLFTHAPLASAFCRTTTCDATKEECFHDQANCTITGLPIFWAARCI